MAEGLGRIIGIIIAPFVLIWLAWQVIIQVPWQAWFGIFVIPAAIVFLIIHKKYKRYNNPHPWD